MTTIGNFASGSTVIFAGQVDKARLAMVISGLDLAGVLLFLSVVTFLTFYQRSMARAVKEFTTSVQDYTVSVEGLPADAANPSEIQRYFQRFGTVSDVQFARNDGQLVRLYFERGRAVNALSDAVARVQREAAPTAATCKADAASAPPRTPSISRLRGLIRQAEAARRRLYEVRDLIFYIRDSYVDFFTCSQRAALS